METGNAGSFANSGDGRAVNRHFRNILVEKENISTSFDPKILIQGSARPLWWGEETVIPSDQNVPGPLPCNCGECFSVVDPYRIRNPNPDPGGQK
jgi:hypothetical protein